MFSIALRDFQSYFRTPLAYAVLAGFITISGFFFFTMLSQFNSVMLQASVSPGINPNLNEWVITPFYKTLEIILVFLIPVLTMRSIAEEKREGTFELLATSPVSVTAIVWGKYLGVSTALFLMLLCSFIFPLSVIAFADPEIFPTITGFFGVILFSLMYAALGIAVSAFTKHQTVAGVVSIVLFLFIYVIHGIGERAGPIGNKIFTYISPSTHSEAIYLGIIASSDIVYFLSAISFGLFLATRALATQRWR